jgi:hypothetical protein
VSSSKSQTLSLSSSEPYSITWRPHRERTTVQRCLCKTEVTKKYIIASRQLAFADWAPDFDLPDCNVPSSQMNEHSWIASVCGSSSCCFVWAISKHNYSFIHPFALIISRHADTATMTPSWLLSASSQSGSVVSTSLSPSRRVCITWWWRRQNSCLPLVSSRRAGWLSSASDGIERALTWTTVINSCSVYEYNTVAIQERNKDCSSAEMWYAYLYLYSILFDLLFHTDYIVVYNAECSWKRLSSWWWLWLLTSSKFFNISQVQQFARLTISTGLRRWH